MYVKFGIPSPETQELATRLCVLHMTAWKVNPNEGPAKSRMSVCGLSVIVPTATRPSQDTDAGR